MTTPHESWVLCLQCKKIEGVPNVNTGKDIAARHGLYQNKPAHFSVVVSDIRLENVLASFGESLSTIGVGFLATVPKNN